MLRISQQTVSFTAKRRFTTAIVQRNVARGSNVKKSLSLLTATAIKRQQPWKLASVYVESKRFYAGEFLDIFNFCAICHIDLFDQ